MTEKSEFDGCAVCHAPRRDHDPETFVEWSDWIENPPGGPLSAHELEALRARYADSVIPPCRVCGADLMLSKAGGGEPSVWRCGSDEADWLGNGEPWSSPPGPRRRHYDQSEHIQRRHGDTQVIRALDELERFRQILSAEWMAAVKDQADRLAEGPVDSGDFR